MSARIIPIDVRGRTLELAAEYLDRKLRRVVCEHGVETLRCSPCTRATLMAFLDCWCGDFCRHATRRDSHQARLALGFLLDRRANP